MKLKLIVLIVIISALIAGCVQAPNQEVTSTVTVTPTLTPTPAPTTILTPEIPKAPKLKIMSITTGQATRDGIPVIFKVKNIGNGAAKDVYVGVINVANVRTGYANYDPNESILLNKSINETLNNGSSDSYIKFIRNEGAVIFRIKSDLSTKDYIGDISTDETKSTQVIYPLQNWNYRTIYKVFLEAEGGGYQSMVKVAWTDDKKEYAIY